MCGSMADIQSATAEIRRGKKEERKKEKKERKKEKRKKEDQDKNVVFSLTYTATIKNMAKT